MKMLSNAGIKMKLAKGALPWVARILIALPFNRKLSLMLDRLLIVAEGQDGRPQGRQKQYGKRHFPTCF